MFSFTISEETSLHKCQQCFLFPVTCAQSEVVTRVAVLLLLTGEIVNVTSILRCIVFPWPPRSPLCQPVMLCKGELIIIDAEQHNYFPILPLVLIFSSVQASQVRMDQPSN